MSVFVELPQVNDATSSDKPSPCMINVNDIQVVLALENGRTVLGMRDASPAFTPLSYEEVKRRINEATAKAAGVPRFIRVVNTDGDPVVIATGNISAVKVGGMREGDKFCSIIHLRAGPQDAFHTWQSVDEIAALLGL